METSTVWRQHSKKRKISPSGYWSDWTGSCSAAPLSVQSSYHYESILWIREVLGHHIDAKISPKAPSEKAQTTVSENTFLKIDVFWTAILALLAPTGNNERTSFLVLQIPHPSATVLRYRRMFTQFSLHVWTSEYTCCLMIANLLYSILGNEKIQQLLEGAV